MSTLSFPILYLACLSVCLGSVEALRSAIDFTPKPPPPQKVERVAVAVPPRPEGVRPVQGEGEDGYRYTEPGCLKLDGQYRDICFHQLARQRAPTDKDGGLAACAAIRDAEMAQECVADVAELFAPADRQASLAICPTIEKKKWRDQCVFGIALALSTIDPDWAFDTCAEAGKWHDFCRHDVNGEIAVINTPLALAHCAEEEGDLLRRKSCWHGIGKYIARVDIDRAFAACDEVPLGPDNLYRENCFHGLGWGAAEKAGASFSRTCSRAGPQEDSCKLGVAYNLRRLDPENALAICSSVQRDDLRGQCDSYVRTGQITGG